MATSLDWHLFVDRVMEKAREADRKTVEEALGSIEASFRETHQGETKAGSPLWARSMADWSSADWSDLTSSLARVGVAGIVKAGSMPLSGDGPDSKDLVLPVAVPLLGRANLVVKATGELMEKANTALQATAIRLLSSVLPGKVRIVGIDSVGLGAALSELLPLSEQIKGPKFWHEEKEIVKVLQDLTSHMAMVQQKYLKNEYSSIDEYNLKAQEIAEPYRVLLVAGFPAGFNQESAQRLISIAQNGPQLGVHVLMSVDTARKLPYDFALDDIERSATVFEEREEGFHWQGGPSTQIVLDSVPDGKMNKELLSEVVELASDGERVVVPFSKIASSTPWSDTTQASLEFPLGKKGANETLRMVLGGEGTSHHALMGGRTGSGKSILLHTIVCAISLKYSPEEVELYLVDFKEGVEFQVYRDLPHARVVAIETEREFGISVLEGLVAELNRRGEVFRREGIRDIAEYRQRTSKPMSRILLLMDEVQVLFAGRTQQKARMLIDDVCRRGRSFGIHVVLVSQAISRDMLEASTLSQLGIRIALQMNERDSVTILGRDNEAARLLERPGEAIFNPAGGLPAKNERFQVAYLSGDDVAQQVAHVRKIAEAKGLNRRPILFEGNRLAHVSDSSLVARRSPTPAIIPRGYDLTLGEPTTLELEHVTFRMRRQTGGNLLLAGADEGKAFRLMVPALASLGTQFANGMSRHLLLNLANVDEEWFDRFYLLEDWIPSLEIWSHGDVVEAITEFHTELLSRVAGQTEARGKGRTIQPPWFLSIFALQRARFPKPEKYGKHESITKFCELLRDGPQHGIHVIAWADVCRNLEQVVGREWVEFGGRVVLGGGDVTKLAAVGGGGHFEPPKQNYALLFNEEHPDSLIKVRCYGEDSIDWLVTEGAQSAEEPN